MTSKSYAKKENIPGQRKLSQLETLKLYEDFKDFRKYMYRAIDKMPRWIKCTEGMECIKSIKLCVRYLARIARTYDKRVKAQYIERFLDEWDVIYDSICFFFEVKGITNHQRDVMARMRIGLWDQVLAFQGWLASQPSANGNPDDSKSGQEVAPPGQGRELFCNV